MILNTLEVVHTVVAKMIHKHWSLSRQLTARLDFAVKYPQGISGPSALAIRTEFSAHTVKVASQGLPKRLATVGTAHGI